MRRARCGRCARFRPRRKVILGTCSWQTACRDTKGCARAEALRMQWANRQFVGYVDRWTRDIGAKFFWGNLRSAGTSTHSTEIMKLSDYFGGEM